MRAAGRHLCWGFNLPSSVTQRESQWVGGDQPQSHTQATHTLTTQWLLPWELWPVAPPPPPVAHCIFLWQSYPLWKSLGSVFFGVGKLGVSGSGGGREVSLKSLVPSMCTRHQPWGSSCFFFFFIATSGSLLSLLAVIYLLLVNNSAY